MIEKNDDGSVRIPAEDVEKHGALLNLAHSVCGLTLERLTDREFGIMAREMATKVLEEFAPEEPL